MLRGSGFSVGYQGIGFARYRGIGFGGCGYRYGGFGGYGAFAYPAVGYGGLGYGGFGFGGYGYRYGSPYGMPVSYYGWAPYPSGPAGYIFTAPSVYTTVAVPAGGGRTILVDMIRGDRGQAPLNYTPIRRAVVKQPPVKQPPVQPPAQTAPATAPVTQPAEEQFDPATLVKPAATTPALVEFLEHPDVRVRRLAADMLIGRGAEGLAALQQAAERGDNPGLRTAALVLLTRAGLDPTRLEVARQVAPALLAVAEDPAPQVRRAAIKGLGQLVATHNPETLDRVLDALRDPDEGVRDEAVSALAQWKEPAIESLVAAIGSDRDVYRNAASRALGQMGPEAVAPLVSLLDSPRASVRFSAASALGDMGLRAEAARDPLQRLATADPDANVRYYAKAALARIER